jgi:hypothetical protein
MGLCHLKPENSLQMRARDRGLYQSSFRMIEVQHNDDGPSQKRAYPQKVQICCHLLRQLAGRVEDVWPPLLRERFHLQSKVWLLYIRKVFLVSKYRNIPVSL